MAWYKSGSVNVTNGSTTVYGNGTLWVDVSVLYSGDVWVGPDGRLYEIASIQSNTQLTLASAYLGATANAQTYAIMPIGLLPSALAQQVKTTLSSANTALSQVVRFDANQNLTSGQKATARSNIGATAAADVGLGLLSKSVAGGVDVVLSADEAANLFYEFTGALTANISVVVPGNVRQFFVRNSTTGAFTLTVKTQGGSGVIVLQGTRGLLECDGTNVVIPTSLQAALSVDSSNKLGVNTSSPGYALDVNGSAMGIGTKSAAPGAGGNVVLRDDTAAVRWLAGILGSAGATSFDLYDVVAGASRLTIDAAGVVTVQKDVKTPADFISDDGKGRITISGQVTQNGLYSTSTNFTAYQLMGYFASAHAFGYGPNPTVNEALRIDQVGNIGIQTTAPGAKLDIGGSATNALQAILTRGGSDGGFVLAARNGSGTAASTEQARFGMEYAGQGLAAGLSFIRGTGALDSSLAVFTNNTERVRVSPGGSVGINTSAPAEKLHVVGNIRCSNGGYVTGGGFGHLRFAPGKIGGTSYGGMYGPTITYNAAYDGSQWVSVGGGSASAIVMDEGTFSFLNSGSVGSAGAPLTFTDRFIVDTSGNMLVGTTSGTSHIIAKDPVNGAPILQVQQGGAVVVAAMYKVDFGGTDGANAANAAFKTGRSSTGRSINTSGTINASGNDYAEYYRKAEGAGVIAKGQIVGIDAQGLLTDKWANAVSFLIKSTDPSYVGGDIWGNEDALGAKRPLEPIFKAPVYAGPAAPQELAVIVERTLPPVNPGDDADDATKAAYEQAQADYELAEALYAQYQVELEAYESAAAIYANEQAAYNAEVAVARHQFDTVTMPAYQAELAAFEVKLEFARQRVDRIAYCGQVPVNVTGATPGQYVIPVQDGDGIAGQLVDDDAITFAQYRRAVGVVQNLLADGRANVRVKVV